MARFRIVPERSHLWIEGRSTLHAIHAGSDGLQGDVELELGPDRTVRTGAPPVGTLSLAVSRLASGNALEDRELYKRVDVGRFPTIDAVVQRLEASDGDGTVTVGGEITFRGVSRHYDHHMQLRRLDGRTIELAGASRFDIRDFGMEPPRMLMLKVDPEVDVRVEIVAVDVGEESRDA
jgi:YceI-like domain